MSLSTLPKNKMKDSMRASLLQSLIVAGKATPDISFSKIETGKPLFNG